MKKVIISLALAFVMVFSFSACSLFDIGGGEKEIKYKVKDGSAVVTEIPNMTLMTQIVIADEYKGVPVTEIADFAGCNLEYVTKITIGKNIEKIGEWAFTNNQKLKEFSVPEENGYFKTVDGVLYSKDMKTVIFFPPMNSSEFVLPESVETVRTKAFYKCGKLEKLTLSPVLKSIEEKAFFRCSSMQNIELPDTLESVAKDAFGYCTSFSQIVLPERIHNIGEYAFYNCTSLIKVDIKAKESDITFGKDWQPTNNGLEIKELEINYIG